MQMSINGKDYYLVMVCGEAVEVCEQNGGAGILIATLPLERPLHFGKNDEDLIRQVIPRLEAERSRLAA